MKKLHYGWIICVCCTLQLFVTAGIPSAAFGVHLPYIIAANGFTNTQSSLIITVRTIAVLCSTVFVNGYLEKTGIRRGLLYASLCGAAGFLMYSSATILFHYYLGAVFSGISVGLAGMVTVSILISRWFHVSRAFALSICSAGSGLATIVLPPVISRMIICTSLATAFRVEALFILMSSVLIFTLLRNTPEEIGLMAYGAHLKEEIPLQKNADRASLTKSGMLLALIAMFLLGGPGTSVSFLTLLYTGSGYSSAAASAIFSAVGMALTVGKFVMGLVTDRLGGYGFTILAYGAFIVGSGLSCILFLQNQLILGITVICVGTGLTVSTIGISYLAEDFSSEETYGVVLKKFQLAHNIGVFVFSYVIGAIADLTGGYSAPFFMLTIILITILAIILRIYKRFRIPVKVGYKA